MATSPGDTLGFLPLLVSMMLSAKSFLSDSLASSRALLWAHGQEVGRANGAGLPSATQAGDMGSDLEGTHVAHEHMQALHLQVHLSWDYVLQ